METKSKTREKIENDLWLANQLEALRQIEPPHTVDVTDAVMKRIDNIQPMASSDNRHNWWKAVNTAVAACITGAILVLANLNNEPLHAATTMETPKLSLRMMDIYDYCHDYADPSEMESASFNDNPLTEII